MRPGNGHHADWGPCILCGCLVEGQAQVDLQASGSVDIRNRARRSAFVFVVTFLVFFCRKSHIYGPEGVLCGVSSGRPFRV